MAAKIIQFSCNNFLKLWIAFTNETLHGLHSLCYIVALKVLKMFLR